MHCDQRERPAPHASILKWGNHLLVEDAAQPGRSPARGPKTIFWLNPVGGDRNRRSGPHRNEGACRARGFGPSYRVGPPLKADPTPRRRSTGLPMRFPENVSRDDHTAKPLKIAVYFQFFASLPSVCRSAGARLWLAASKGQSIAGAATGPAGARTRD